MSADFWAGYVSGAVGIVIGNPLDILKVRLQAASPSAPSASPLAAAPTATAAAPAHSLIPASSLRTGASALVTGTAAPVLGYGALNALLFVSYNRTEALLNGALSAPAGAAPTAPSLWSTWVAGAVGGLATWIVSTPTELVKCRAQVGAAPSPSSPAGGASSWAIAREVLRAEGVRGFYFGGAVTALRDSIGYGFYFWSYELSSRWAASAFGPPGPGTQAPAGAGGSPLLSADTARVLLCGGLAGIVTWASVFPLDVIKTRVQTQAFSPPAAPGQTTPLLASRVGAAKRLGAIEVAREAYREAGLSVFFRGLVVCSVRAFVVNAVQWAVYEWIMAELGQGRRPPSIEAHGELAMER